MANCWTKPGAVDKSTNSRFSRSTPGKPASSLLILGYGNPLRGDDALGPLVAEELAEKFRDRPGVTVQSAQQLTLDLAETLADYDLVVLIDARLAAPPGEVYTQEIRSAEQLPQAFSHYLTPGELLAAAEILYRGSPRLVLTGINAAGFEVGAPLSEPVRYSVPKLVALIEELAGGS